MRDKLVPVFFPNIKPAVWDVLHINECLQAIAKQIHKMLINSDKSFCIWQYTGVLKSGVCGNFPTLAQQRLVCQS